MFNEGIPPGTRVAYRANGSIVEGVTIDMGTLKRHYNTDVRTGGRIWAFWSHGKKPTWVSHDKLIGLYVCGACDGAHFDADDYLCGDCRA